MLGLRSESLTQ
jgi:CCR4-NOT transcription complex subunit 1